MSSWYKADELAHRIGILYAGVALANMYVGPLPMTHGAANPICRFGGLIAAGVLADLNMAHGIAGWRWLFIIEGTATVGIALIAA
jgi:hypothetical protein